MGFMGIFLMFLFVFLAVMFFFTSLSIVFLILAMVLKKKKRKVFVVFLVLGILCGLPLLGFIGSLIYAWISTSLEHHGSLSYQVTNGNFAQAERLLNKGVSPDCTLGSNEPAADGEETLLCWLCDGGLTDTDSEPSTKNQGTKDNCRMAKLLLDYGADVNYVTYRHEYDDSIHTVTDETSYYMPSDRCGRTPFLLAVENVDEDMVSLLVEYGADIEARDFCGFGALEILADECGYDEGRVELASDLLKLGCRADELTRFGQDILFLTTRNTNYPDVEEFLRLLVEQRWE